MVQEVQTGIGITQQTTLETIEAIGTSSFKIREWRQTTDRFTRGCVATGNVSAYLPNTWTSAITKSTDLAITEQTGKEGFSMSGGWIRIPVAWAYQIMLHWGWGGSNVESTISIRTSNRELYTKTFSGSSQKEDVLIPADLGKFETVQLRWKFKWNGSWPVTLTFSTTPVLTIQQL